MKATLLDWHRWQLQQERREGDNQSGEIGMKGVGCVWSHVDDEDGN